MRARWTPLLAAAVACLPLTGQAQGEAPLAEVFGGAHQMDCEPVGPIQPPFLAACQAALAKGALPTYRFSVDAADRWTVSPSLTNEKDASQVLEVTLYEGHRCLKAQMLAVCEAPRNADMFKNAPSGSNVRSRSGLVLLVTNVGVLDLKKVAKQ